MGISVGTILAIAAAIVAAAVAAYIGVSRLIDSRNAEEFALKKRTAQDAAEKAGTMPFREIEDEFRIDKYRYPTIHNGWSTHQRYRRPTSRSSEQEQHRRAEESLDKILESTSGGAEILER